MSDGKPVPEGMEESAVSDNDQTFVERCHFLLDEFGFGGQQVPLDERLRQLAAAWKAIQEEYETLRRVARVSAQDWGQILGFLEAHRVYAYTPEKLGELIAKLEVAAGKPVPE